MQAGTSEPSSAPAADLAALASQQELAGLHRQLQAAEDRVKSTVRQVQAAGAVQVLAPSYL